MTAYSARCTGVAMFQASAHRATRGTEGVAGQSVQHQAESEEKQEGGHVDGPRRNPSQHEEDAGVDHGRQAAEPVLAVVEDRELTLLQHVLAHEEDHGVVRVNVAHAEGEGAGRHPDHPDVGTGDAQEHGYRQQAPAASAHVGDRRRHDGSPSVFCQSCAAARRTAAATARSTPRSGVERPGLRALAQGPGVGRRR